MGPNNESIIAILIREGVKAERNSTQKKATT